MAIEVRKKEGETVQSLIYRFTKKIKQSGVLTEVRKRQFKARNQSKLKKRSSAIYRSLKQEEFNRKRKLGLLNY
ncbi:MAG: 30S ribosomal protein S21 [Patescibacteria group bacterium]|nr:30S ribosomal protein S21 [Patescibacteria group bacterium]MCX7589938.1 30S ribosomal protein S21 [Patescibacteria group bacterium]MDW8279784.1 30S ribosomal protein S21 [bacterium]